MQDQSGTIEHVSDTALWVAYYRAKETERKDALFQDPFAKLLIGDRGRKIARQLQSTSKYTAWTLAIRTYVIDRYIKQLIRDEVDTVLNLGAGLDTRPYRMDVPSSLQWIEVDYPHMIEHKQNLLQQFIPKCELEQVPLDLADRSKRKELLARVASQSKKVLVLTEGVIPYLTEAQVHELAQDLREFSSLKFWITEYFSPETAKYLKDSKRLRAMKNSPFLFFPADWFGFFKQDGWTPRDVTYLPEESLKLGRKVPGPWWIVFVKPFIPADVAAKHLKMTGYILLEHSH